MTELLLADGVYPCESRAFMFEQSAVSPESRRGWAVMAGFAGQFLIVGGALLAPLLWPELLPRAQLFTWILAPAVPPSPTRKPPPVNVRAARPRQFVNRELVVPRLIPPTAAVIDDPPQTRGAAIEGSVEGGPLLDDVLHTISRLPSVPAAAPLITQQPLLAPRRIMVGGNVQMARLVHQVQPIYPPLARQTRISGTVELVGVIAVDGHIRELRMLNGHPFLAAAAVDAVRQWVYQPTLLNGDPVEVVAPITVNFRLN